ncbi:MAG: NAD-dependent deacylase [Anaerolineae bacterium]
MTKTEGHPIEIPQQLIEQLRQAKDVAVLTGAGVSAESGVPTFREAQTGLWARYDPQELATPQAFQHNPRLVWDWYAWRRELVSQAKPKAGHLALTVMERHLPRFTLITQNVDGLHAIAGSRNILELHGNIMRTKCFDDGETVEAWAPTAENPPRCPRCGGRLRPDVVWFGESLPAAALAAAFDAARSCDLFFSIGTSAVVHPAASLPMEALHHRIPVVEVNPQETPLTPHVTFTLPGPAGIILPALVQAAWP